MATGVLVFVVIGTVLTTASWVAIDSEKYDWGEWHHPTRQAWNPAATSRTTWFVAVATLWPVFFAGYFWDRHYAPRK